MVATSAGRVGESGRAARAGGAASAAAQSPTPVVDAAGAASRGSPLGVGYYAVRFDLRCCYARSSSHHEHRNFGRLALPIARVFRASVQRRPARRGRR